MIRKNKIIAGLLLFTMLMSGIPEGFGVVSSVYADENKAVAEAEVDAEADPEEEVKAEPEADAKSHLPHESISGKLFVFRSFPFSLFLLNLG